MCTLSSQFIANVGSQSTNLIVSCDLKENDTSSVLQYVLSNVKVLQGVAQKHARMTRLSTWEREG